MKPLSRKDLLKRVLHSGMFVCFGLNAAVVAACCDIQAELQARQVDEIATATLNTYSELLSHGCNDTDLVETASCSGGVFTTWNNIRALVHTANDLSGIEGPTEFSLGTDTEGLIEALRWTAGEEFSSHESMMEGFSNSQLSNISARIGALRNGASGFALNGFSRGGNNAYTPAGKPQTGLNAGDALWSRWGGFLNVSYTEGNLDPSAQEDAYDFDGMDVNAGLDYRLDDHWVAGGMLAYVTQDVDFDSSLSTVDGTVKMDGIALTGFLLYQADAWYYSASVGYQSSTFDTERSIQYTSLNINIPSPNTVAISANDASTLSANMNAGYVFQVTDAFSIEPSLGVNYQDLTIDQFKEKDVNNDGFNLLVLEQNFASLETIAALKAQYVLSSDYGVFMPFLDVQNITQHYTDARAIKAVYANIAGTVSTDAYMQLLTDNLDSETRVVSIGVASVLRGASQKTLDAPANGGIQGFLKVSEILDAGHYHQRIITGGLRYEF